MKTLLNSEQKPVEKANINEYTLMHSVTINNNLELVKLMIYMNPKVVYKICREGKLSIHDVKSEEV
jgi:hypothetical protein